MSEKILHVEEVAYLDFLNLLSILQPTTDEAINTRIISLKNDSGIYNEAYAAQTYFDPANSETYQQSNSVVRRLAQQKIVFESMDKFTDKQFNDALIQLWGLYQNLDIPGRMEFLSQTSQWLEKKTDGIPILSEAPVEF